MNGPSIAVCVVLIAGVCAGPLVRAQSVKPALRKLRVAIGALDEKAETGQRAVKAIEGLAAFDGAPAATALLDAAQVLAGLAATITEKRKKALIGEGGSGRLKRARYELRNVQDAAAAVAGTVAELHSPPALREMLKRLTDRGSTLPLWFRLQLAARIPELPGEQINWRPRKMKSPTADTLIALLSVGSSLGPRAGKANGHWVGEQLLHESPDVRSAAARALGQMAWSPAIELLIGRIDMEDGEGQEAVLEALSELTSQDPGDSGSSWRAWLKTEGGPYVRGEKPLSKGYVQTRKREVKGQTSSGTYFGISQVGESILYVFDNSQSMKAKVGKAPKDKDPSTVDNRPTRWDLCCAELRSGLRGLRPGQKFNLVSFANKARSFEPKMQDVSEDNIARAIEWIGSLKLEFETNVFDALELAFLLAGRGSEDRYYPSQVDTLFMLSDGAPTIAHLSKSGIGKDDSDRILRAVQRWNPLGRVTVHAVGIGLQKRKKDRNPKGRLWPAIFLKKLASQNGGDYVLRR